MYLQQIDGLDMSERAFEFITEKWLLEQDDHDAYRMQETYQAGEI